MRTLAALLLLLSLASASAGAADAEFDTKEKISLDLKDAKITDLVTLLGALASMPVYIDPDVSGPITIKLEDVPYEKVLKIINAKTGVFVRIENGKLVASRSNASLFAAQTLPPRFGGVARIPVADVRRATSDLPPLYAQIWVRGAERCARLQFRDGEMPTITVPLSEDGSVPPLYVTQFEVDPVSKARSIALDGPVIGGVTVGHLAAPVKRASADGSIAVRLGESAVEPCRDESLREPTPRTSVTLTFLARENGPDGPGEVVMSPRLQVQAGSTAKARTGRADAATGQQREVVLAAYVSRDAKWTTAVLSATAIWIDPADGQEYFYSQPAFANDAGRVIQVQPQHFGSSPELLTGPSNEPVAGESLLTIAAGVAAPREIELFLVTPREKPDALQRK